MSKFLKIFIPSSLLLIPLVMFSSCSNHVVDEVASGAGGIAEDIGGGVSSSVPIPLSAPSQLFVGCTSTEGVGGIEVLTQVQYQTAEGGVASKTCPGYHTSVELTPESKVAICPSSGTYAGRVVYYQDAIFGDEVEVSCTGGQPAPFNWGYANWQIKCEVGDVYTVQGVRYNLFGALVTRTVSVTCPSDQIIDKSRDISPLITTWARMDGVVCPGAVAGDPSFFEIRYSGLDPVLDDLNTGFLGEGYYDCNSGDLVNISAQTVYDQNFYPNF